MYVHKNCRLKEMELDMDKRVGGFCVICSQEGTVYHVKGTEDYYEQIVAGILYKIFEGKRHNTREAIRTRLKAQVEHTRAMRDFDGWNESMPAWEARTEQPWIAPLPDVETLKEFIKVDPLPHLKEGEVAESNTDKFPEGVGVHAETGELVDFKTEPVEELDAVIVEEVARQHEKEEPEKPLEEAVEEIIEEAVEEVMEATEKAVDDMTEDELRARLKALEDEKE